MASTIINSDDGSSTGAAGFYLVAGDDGKIVFQSNGANVAVVTPSGPGGTPPVKFEVLGDIEASEFIGIPEGVPSGAVQYFAMDTAPTGYLKANGATVSRSTFAALFSAIGTAFGSGDGSTTFGLPDLRGEFLRGFDDGRGVDSGRSFGTAQGEEFKSHRHNRGGNVRKSSYSFNGANTGFPIAADSANQGIVNSGVTSFAGGDETRPRNIALLACIKF